MFAALDAELYGIRHRRSFPVLSAVWLLQIVLFAYLANYIVSLAVPDLPAEQVEAMRDSLLPAHASAAVVGSLPMYGAPILIILGALIGAGDDRSGIIRAIMSRFPDRDRFIGGKSVALVVVVGVLMAVSMVVAAACAAVIAAIEGAPFDFALLDVVRDLAFAWLIGTAWGMVGFALGVLTRSLALTIAIGVIWALVVEQAIHGLAGIATVLEPVRIVLISGASAVVADAAGVAAMPGGVPDASLPVAILVLAGWIVLGAGIALATFRARDVT
jgi:ABC-2 type transport system permease protein